DVTHRGGRGGKRCVRLNEPYLTEAGILDLLDGRAEDDIARLRKALLEGVILLRITGTLEQDVEGDGPRPFTSEGLHQVAVQTPWPGAGRVDVARPVGILVDRDDADPGRDGTGAAQEEQQVEPVALVDRGGTP